MDTVILAILTIIFVTVWIVALCNWDGECHCSPEDCDTCPYGQGSGFCEHEAEIKHKKGDIEK